MADVAVVGSINADLTIELARPPRPGETVLGDTLRRGPGGKGANQAVACARLGRTVEFVGAVGDDGDGTWLADVLAGEGVGSVGVHRLVPPSGLALVLVEPDGESSIVVVPGANHELQPEHLDQCRDLLASARAVLAQHEIRPEVVRRVAELATGLFVLNPAPGRPVESAVLDRVDVLIPNRHELALLAGTGEPGDVDGVVEVARSLEGPSGVVVTLGAEGALAIRERQVTRVPAHAVEVIDTTAAGDTFCAALVDALLDDASLADATHWAVKAAAVTVTRPGAMAALPTRNELVS